MTNYSIQRSGGGGVPLPNTSGGGALALGQLRGLMMCIWGISGSQFGCEFIVREFE